MERLTDEQLQTFGDPTFPPANRYEAAQMASELLNLRRRDEDLGFAYDHARQLLDILGTKFSRHLLESYQRNLPLDGRDEYYQHVRHEPSGAVYLTRFIGVREQLRLLRECLQARPEHSSLTSNQFEAVYLEWSEAARLLLETSVQEVGAEAVAVQRLIDDVRVFRGLTAWPIRKDSPETQEAQLEAGNRLFGSLEQLDFARDRLRLWGKTDGLPAPGSQAGTCAACGCTEDAACEGGCGWADATRTRCTRCAESAPVREASS